MHDQEPTISQNVTPRDPLEGYRPTLFPTLERCGRAVLHFFTQRHTIPQRGAEAVLDAHMDVEDEQLSFGFDSEGRYLEDER